jgi:hypothetical protein
LSDYAAFLHAKTQSANEFGFTPRELPGFLFDFQASIVDWALRKGRAAIFADCGLGKSPMELVWGDRVAQHTGGRVLLLTPLAVGPQMVAEAEKFGIEARRSLRGELFSGIVVANYERLHLFDPSDFRGVICDESSILKNFDGQYKSAITEFMRKVEYRLLATATAAPNDYIELGTSAEALGELGYMDMLSRFFKNDQGNAIKTRVFRQGNRDFAAMDEAAKWRFKGHAEVPFWRWVSSWARAIRRPSDLGFSDERFILPALTEREHIVTTQQLRDGMLFAMPAVGLKEQREERRLSIEERCDKVSDLVLTNEQAIVWCHLNEEGDSLARIPGAVQVSGKDSDDAKEEKFAAFSKGDIRVLVTKPKIGAWGLNFQNCAHVLTFPSHSFEQYYQSVRRCWRFGQKREVVVDVIATDGEGAVLKNLQRKAEQADKMFSALVEQMNAAIRIDRGVTFTKKTEIPSWL